MALTFLYEELFKELRKDNIDYVRVGAILRLIIKFYQEMTAFCIITGDVDSYKKSMGMWYLINIAHEATFNTFLFKELMRRVLTSSKASDTEVVL